MAAAISSNTALKTKFRGCMIGALLGDCLGLPFEGQSPICETTLCDFLNNHMIEDTICIRLRGILKNLRGCICTFAHPQTAPLPYSDDTSMTLSVASSLVDRGEIDIKDMAKRPSHGFSTISLCQVAQYSLERNEKSSPSSAEFLSVMSISPEQVLRFVDQFCDFESPRRGYGAAVRDVFMALLQSNYNDVLLPAKMQFEGAGSYGNGAAMRIAPVALFGHNKGEQYIIDGAKQCSLITHAHANGYNGAILQCLAVNAALELDSHQDLDPVQFISNLQEKMENIETEDKNKPYCESLKKIKEIYLQNQDLSSEEIAAHLGNGVAALESVPTAIYSFLRGMKPLKEYKSSNRFLRTIYFSISVGYDTDTIASMAGAIAGAYYGMDIIPKVLKRKCEYFNEISRLADKLYDVVQKKD